MPTLWGRANSTNVKKVLWCLAEIGLPFEHVEAGGAHGVVDTPAFRAMNPNGLVPVLRDGDLVLWESNAIVRYLAAVHSSGRLYPTDPATRARGDRWMDWCSTTLAPVFRTVFWGLVRTPPEKRDGAAIAATTAEVSRLLAMVDAELAGSRHLGGDDFSMGDIPLGAYAYAWFEMPVERPPMPGLERWYAALRDRPAYRAAIVTPLT
ncbi:glutathione S-transferase family protein [Oharaeibacter diazotrophicus]|uniref:Glutathione S-transferase n=1 Tax=Oharaeibacter diazotrophicus TaxID=1920512 RepID=A0A4R6RFY9_9HYPH|nr:glutathione S-transferase [Oharaeibacter diazotrophicus]TDP85269.1 glutathione S-transferase [Oharaeibacter diazotrophicus]BBE74240.1 glutathione S-transferase GstB [Pleomorphomonas sp. SM30]GLS76071.1 glutathione S-transferase [Oharaeibacter diazotrophicus]